MVARDGIRIAETSLFRAANKKALNADIVLSSDRSGRHHYRFTLALSLVLTVLFMLLP
jgi:hypothetical protein